MARVLRDTTKVDRGVWSDPGDYPNNVASGPLPDRPCIDEIGGEIKVILGGFRFLWWEFGERAEVRELLDPALKREFHEWIGEHVDYRFDGILSVEWGARLDGNVLTLWVEDYEADPDWRDDDGREYDPVEKHERRAWLRQREAEMLD